ncbi:MAG: ATP-binding cassette domain-containing protein, partial [Chloroflexi bacterium]
MATELERGGEGADGADKATRRKRRARRRAQEIAQAAITVPVAPAPIEPETPVPAEAATESAPVVTVRARSDRRRITRRIAEPPAPPAVKPSEPEVEPAGPDEFRDLLGQAVGLRLDSVGRVFDAGDQQVTALRDVSLEIAPGEFVSVIGPSGCGKTTLLSLMGGLDRPTSGQVYVAGMALDQLDEDALADYRLQRVSTIFQTFNLVPAMSAEENVALPLVLAGAEPQERRERARRLL